MISASPENRPRRRVPAGRLIILTLLALILAFLASIRISLQNRLDKSLAEIRAAGLPASPAEIIAWRPLPPPSQNGAPALLDACEQIIPFGPRTNNSLVTALVRSNFWSPDLLVQFESYLATNRRALQNIEAALAFPQFGFISDYSLGLQTELPHLTLLRDAATLLRIRSGVRAEHAMPEASAADIFLLLRLAQTLDREPLSISWLVRNSIILQAVHSTERLLNRTAPPAAICQNLQRAFASALATNLLPEALVGERAASLSVFRLATRPPPVANAPPPNNLQNLAQGVGSVGFSAIGFFERDQAFFLRTMERAIEFASMPPPQSLLITNFMAEAVAEMKSKRYILSSLIMVALQRLTVKAAESQAHATMARASLAIESFRQSRQALPQNLTNLIPDFLESLPIDPFDAQPLRYQTNNHAYRLWSIGPDGKDDQGATAPSIPRPKNATYDLVFQVDRIQPNN